MKKGLLLLISIVFIFSNCDKDPEDTPDNASGFFNPILVKTYNHYQSEYFSNAIIDSDNNLLLVGSTYGTEPKEMFVQKIDQSGNNIWSISIADTNELSGRSIIETDNKHYLVIGYTLSFAPGRIGMIIAKLNNQGELIWKKEYRNWLNGNGRSIIVKNEDKTFMIAGSYFRRDFKKDVFVMRINENGDSLWSNTTEHKEGVYCNSLIKTNDGGFAVIGSSDNHPKFVLLKYNSLGELEWLKEYENEEPEQGGGSSARALSLVQNGDNHFYLFGSTASYEGGKAYLLKTDETGDELWRKYYKNDDSGAYSMGHDIRITKDNQLLMTINVDGMGVFMTNLIKINSDGDQIWNKFIDHYQANQAFEIQSGNISLMGNTYYNSIYGSDIFYCVIRQ